MPWVKLDDHFDQHPKVTQIGNAAFAIFVAGLAYSNRSLTDGFIPYQVGLGQLRWTEEGAAKACAELEKVGLWERVEGGWQIHDYDDYQPSRDSVLAERDKSRRRSAMNNDPGLRKAVKGRDGDWCRYCGVKVNWSDRKGRRGGTYDHVIPMAHGGGESADNIVVSCRDCNETKGARTPDEAGMPLLAPRSKASASRLDGIRTESERNLAIRQDTPVPVPAEEAAAASNGLRADAAAFEEFNLARATDEARSRKRRGLNVINPAGLARKSIAPDPDFQAESHRLWTHRECPTCGGSGFTEQYAPGAGQVKTPCQEHE